MNFIHLSKCQSCFLTNSSILQHFYGPSSGLISTPGVFLLVYIREVMRKTVLLSQGSQGFEYCDPKSKCINGHELSHWIQKRILHICLNTLIECQSMHPLEALNLIQPVTGVTIQHSQSYPGNPVGHCPLIAFKSLPKYPSTRLWDTLTKHFLFFLGQ